MPIGVEPLEPFEVKIRESNLSETPHSFSRSILIEEF